MCVQIDLFVPLQEGVWIEAPQFGFFQIYFYENLPSIWFWCGCIGHKWVDCSSKMDDGDDLAPLKFAISVVGDTLQEIIGSSTLRESLDLPRKGTYMTIGSRPKGTKKIKIDDRLWCWRRWSSHMMHMWMPQWKVRKLLTVELIFCKFLRHVARLLWIWI